MEWNPAEQDLELFSHVKKLLELRRTFPEFGNGGEFKIIDTNPETNYLVYAKTSNERTIYFVVNNLEQQLDVSLSLSQSYQQLINLWTEDTLQPTEHLEFQLNPLDFKIILAKH
nr:alpha-glucosidase C-terminal domain-containing protein [Litchfieldia salsa]